MRIATILMVTVIAVASAGCGGTFPRPSDEWAAAQTDVGAAQAGGAPSVPDAKLHLELSQEDLKNSKDLMDQGDNKRAASLIAVARVEAQLALSLARASTAADQARQAQADVQKAKGN